MDRYDSMSDEELERHVRMRGVPSGPRETFPGRSIITWLRLRDRDDADAARWDGYVDGLDDGEGW